MKFYFVLRCRLISRYLADSGINPVLLCLIILISFVMLSQYLISKTTYAHYAYALVPVILASGLSSVERNIFLRSCFSDHQYNGIRLIENSLVALPFVIMLAVNLRFTGALIAILFSSLLSVIRVSPRYHVVIPTPFYRFPFEFLVGFRKAFPMIVIAYIFAGIAIAVANFNLGVFSLILLLLICLSFYMEPESKFYVWCYSMTSTEFILSKLKVLIIYMSMLTFPVLIALVVAFSDRYMGLLAVQVVGYISACAALLAKYSWFPRRLPLPHLIIFTIAVIFVPSVIVLIPYYYFKSRSALKEILK